MSDLRFRTRLSRLAALAGFGACMYMGTASAQMSPSEIRSILGAPVDLEKAALFAATRSSYKSLCGAMPWAELHANIINRLHYGSLDEQDKAVFVERFQTQLQSNTFLFQKSEPAIQRALCEGFDHTLTSMAADFVEAHPDLFTETDAREEKKVEGDFEVRSMFLNPNWDPSRRTVKRSNDIRCQEELALRKKWGEIGPSGVRRDRTVPGFVSRADQQMAEAEARSGVSSRPRCD